MLEGGFELPPPSYAYGRGNFNFVLKIHQELVSTWRIASVGNWNDSSAMWRIAVKLVCQDGSWVKLLVLRLLSVT